MGTRDLLGILPPMNQLAQLQSLYTVGGTAPLPAFIVRAKGCHLWDVNGKRYIDFLCMFGAVNHGHSHPVIVEAVKKQLETAALINASTNNALWPTFAEMMCTKFGYGKIASAVSGTDATDAACRIARKWAITKKGVPPENLVILGVSDCYHGLSSGVWGLQNRSIKQHEYGLDDRHLMNFNPSSGSVLTYGNLEEMKLCLSQHHARIAAVILECIRGILPTFQEEIDYAQGVYDLCNTYNVLFIADEIRMGICRTGKLLSSDYLGPSRKPNMITLGKSITGGVYPASYILGDESVMSVVGTREIMFTYAFSPLAIVATRAALQVAETERLSDRASELERLFLRQAKEKKWEDYPFVNYVTARGAEFGIWLVKGNELLCRKIGFSCMDKGLLLFPKELHLKMSSTIAIGDDEFEKALKVLAEAIEECSQEYYTPSKRHRAHL